MSLDLQTSKKILAYQEELHQQFKRLIEWFFPVYTSILKQKNSMLRQRGYTFDKKENIKISKFLELKLSQLHSLYVGQKKAISSILHEEKVYRQKCLDLERNMNSESTLNLELTMSPTSPDYIEHTPQTKKKVRDWPVHYTDTVKSKIKFWEGVAGKNLLDTFTSNI